MGHRKLLFAAVLMLLLSTGCSTRAQPSQSTNVRSQIMDMLGNAAAAWNRGDLDAFMSDYLDDRRTTFVGSAGVLRGPLEIRTAYAARFAPDAVRDSLSFENVEVDLLAPDVAHVLGWYVLSRGDSVVARGPTSLVMEREGGRWLIVHDHSS